MVLCYSPYQLLKVDVEEVMYIVKELWRGRSARDQSIKDVGRSMWRSVNELMLVRWECKNYSLTPPYPRFLSMHRCLH